MATYKVPQDVEADDKLLGPLSFRQFVYVMIALGLITLAVFLFQIFPLLAVIPIPFAFFLIIMALPIKKDQPMETYLAALISFYTKPNRRFWIPGQRESTITIVAPKKVEPTRVRNITGEEAGYRLSFLAGIIDTEGYAIKNAGSPVRDEFYAEANGITDMFDQVNTNRLTNLISKEQQARHNEAVNQMRAAIQNSEAAQTAAQPQQSVSFDRHVIQPSANFVAQNINPEAYNAGLTANPTVETPPHIIDTSSAVIQPLTNPEAVKQMGNLAYNPDYSVQTIQQQADRIRQENEKEVYVSLH